MPSTTTSTTLPSTTTSTTLPPPKLVQTTLTFTQDGLEFTGVALVAAPLQPPPHFFLRLSADEQQPIYCGPEKAKPAARAIGSPALKPRGNGVTKARGTSHPYDGQVNRFPLTCDATALPPTFSPALEVFEPQGAETFVPVTIVNNTDASWLDWLPLGGGLVLALASVVGVWLLSREGRSHRALGTAGAKSPWAVLRNTVSADVAWDGSDSWVTNVGALGATATTVMGAVSSSLASVLPGLPAARIEVLSLTCGALLALGPLIYAILAKKPSVPQPSPTLAETLHVSQPGGQFDKAVVDVYSAPAKSDSAQNKTVGTVAGVLLGSVATLTAVAGEFITLAFLVHLSTARGAAEVWLYLALLAAAAIVGCYSVRALKLFLETSDYQTGHDEGDGALSEPRAGELQGRTTPPAHPPSSSFLTHKGTVSGTL